MQSNNHIPLEIKEVTQQLFDKMAIFAITFGSIVTLSSLSRILQFGWHLTIIVDIFTYIIMIVLLQTRRKLPSTVVAAAFLLLLCVNAFCNFIFAGFDTAAMIMLCSCCVVAGTIFGFRTGFYMLVISTIGLSAIAVLYITGILQSPFNFSNYLRSPSAWFAQISGFLVFSAACLTVIHFIQDKMLDSIRQLKVRSEELHTSEKQFRRLAENMHDVLLLLDKNLSITYISPSVTTMFGYQPQDLVTCRIDILAPVATSALLLTMFSDYMTQPSGNNLKVQPFECTLTTQNQCPVPAEFTPSLIFDENGQLSGIQCILRDLSGQKRAEEERDKLEKQLRHSEKLEVIGQLAGGIAHDFNNQLAGVLGFAEIIKSDHPRDSETHAHAQAIASIARHSADLTSKLLAFARKGNYRLQTFNLHTIITEVIDILARSIDKSIKITSTLQSDIFYVKGDPGQIQNALLNIALNARDAMQNGGTLSFFTTLSTIGSTFTSPYQDSVTPGEYIHLIISDTGTGIDDDTKQHLFEPFFTTKEPGKGTGMGLAAVYGTIQTHGGVLNVTSTVAEGTSFHIYLPVCSESPAYNDEEVTTSIKKGSGNILIVEDEPSVGKMMKMILRRLGYSATLCSDGNSALTTYKKDPRIYEAVIIDLILPDMSGKALTHEIRKINAKERVLICSGYRSDINIQKLIDDTNTLFIQKPFSMNELSEMLSRLLGLKSANRC